MAWVRIEDTVTDHRKHLKAGPAACWLWVCGLAYCQRQLSDGMIPTEALPQLGAGFRISWLVKRLVSAGLFDKVPGGFMVHDYHDYNETREEALTRKRELSEQRAAAGRIGGLRSGLTRRGHKEANTEANVKQLAEAKRSPDPTRPIPSPRRTEEERRPLLPARGGPPMNLGLKRLKVWRWMLEDLIDTLGAHAVAFDVEAWLLDLDAKETRVVESTWPWLKDELVLEVRRRGLPVAAVAKGAESTESLTAGVRALLKKREGIGA